MSAKIPLKMKEEQSIQGVLIVYCHSLPSPVLHNARNFHVRKHLSALGTDDVTIAFST